MPGATFVEGESVRLCTVAEEDLPFVHGGQNHPDVRRDVGLWYPSTLGQEREWYEEASESDEVVQLLVVAAVDGEPVGLVELDPVDRTTGRAELGFWIHPDDWGNGYAREALALLLDYAFAELRVHKVAADAYASNEGSRDLLESLGFVEEGVDREADFVDGAYVDLVRFGLLEDEWRD